MDKPDRIRLHRLARIDLGQRLDERPSLSEQSEAGLTKQLLTIPRRKTLEPSEPLALSKRSTFEFHLLTQEIEQIQHLARAQTIKEYLDVEPLLLGPVKTRLEIGRTDNHAIKYLKL